MLTFIRFQNSSNLAVSKNEILKFRINVLNPNKIKQGGLDIRIVSNYAKYIYEYKKMSDLFETHIIALYSVPANYLWGLSKGNSPCPIRSYLSVGTAVWNKISFNFYPNLTFPTCLFHFTFNDDLFLKSLGISIKIGYSSSKLH